MSAFPKIAISGKTKSFGTFCQFFLGRMDLWHYPPKYSFKNKVFENLNIYPTPSKTLGDHPRKKRRNKDGSILFGNKIFVLSYMSSKVEAIFFAMR